MHYTWIKRGSWAILDQSMFSGANFIFNIFLARWLTSESYGSFAIAFAIILILSSFHNAFILEPLSVFGSSRFAKNLQEYCQKTLHLHYWITIPIGILLSLAGLIVIKNGYSLTIASAYIGAGLALPFILVIWWSRRVCYVIGKPNVAFINSLIYALILLVGLVLINSIKIITPITAFICMGMAGGLSAIWNSKNRSTEPKKTILKLDDICKFHWTFGKWIALAGILNLAGGQAQIFMIAAFGGLEDAGELRAMYNFFLPMAQIITAVTTLALTSFSQDFAQQHFSTLFKKAAKLTLLLTIFAIVYEITILFAVPSVERLIYQEKYASSYKIAYILGIMPILSALAAGPILLLRAMQRPVFYPLLGLVSTFAGLVTGVLFIMIWGEEGAAWSMVFAAGITTIFSYYICYRWFLPTLNANMIILKNKI